MTLFLMGLVVVLAVRRLVVRPTPRGGTLWVLPLALLVVGQIVSRGDLLAGYQIQVLGQRFSLSDASVERTLSGDPDASDVYVEGAGSASLARLAVSGDTLAVLSSEGSGGVVLVRTGRGTGPDWTALRQIPLSGGSRVLVQQEGVQESWTFHRRSRAFGVLGTEDRLVGPRGEAVLVPYPQDAGLVGLFPGRPSIFQRTYPLADLLASFQVPAAAALSSFLYYRDGEPFLALLDASVSVEAASGEPALPLTRVALGAGVGPGSRIMVAGLPHRDFPDPRLAPGERYGVRPLRAFDPRVDEGWLTLAQPAPHVVSLPVAEQEQVMLTRDGREIFPVWIAPGAGDGAVEGVALPDFSNRFGAASQALVRLPVETAAGEFQLLTPSGLAEWSTGRPLTLGDDDRGILIRVDGLAVSPALILVLVALFGLAAVPLLAPLTGKVKALALVGLGLVSVRVLLSLSALARYPFVDEGHPISLWLIPALPWFVCALGRGGAGGRSGEASAAVVPRGFSGGYMGTVGRRQRVGIPWTGGIDVRSPVFTVAVPAVALVLLAFVLFPASPVRSGALGVMTVAVAAWTLAGPRRPGLARARDLWRRTAATPFPGATLGAALLLVRGGLEVAGYREQISLGGVRIGISVLYTPLAALLFGLLLWVHLERVNRARGADAHGRVARAWLDLGLFLATAFVGVSLWISDFGIGLTALPGPLLILLAVGFHWSRRFGPGAALGGLLPLALFLALQVEPALVRPGLSEAPISTRLEDWSRNELLLLERGDPDLLRLIGESRSEALAVMRETMRSYTRGSWTGRGFLHGRVSSEIRSTAAREHAVGGLIASQWGLLGTLGLVAMLLAAVLPFVHDLPGPGGRAGSARSWALGTALLIAAVALLPPPADLVVLAASVAVAGGAALLPLLGAHEQTGAQRLWWPDAAPDGDPAGEGGADVWWLIGAGAVLTFSCAGLYMVLANYGLVLFTGKNVYLLGLDSLGDTLEAMALLAVASVGLARAAAATAVSQDPEEDVGVGRPEADARALIGRRRAG